MMGRRGMVLGRREEKGGGKGTGRRDGFLGRGKEEKGEKKKKRWAGWAEKERGKRKAFPFLKRFKHIQFKFKLIRIQI